MTTQKPREFLVIDNTDNSGYSAKIMPEREREFFKKYRQTTAVNGIYCREVLPVDDNAPCFGLSAPNHTPPKTVDDLFEHPCKQTCSGWKQGYDKGHSKFQSEMLTSQERVKELEEIIERGDAIKNNWENNCYTEATHYTWLDDQNESLRAALTEAEKALEVCECGCKEMICEKYCAKLKAIQTLRAIAEGKK